MMFSRVEPWFLARLIALKKIFCAEIRGRLVLNGFYAIVEVNF